MAVDKNLFLYDLAVVAIMKNEAPYVKEWIDYHLSAGVDHFYIYDNDSPDNLKEVLQPYIDAGIVTYTFYPGKCRQMEAYIDAVHRFRFFSRYMAWIDADEFIFPQNNKSVVEVADEIFNAYPNAGGIAANIMTFGSNYQKKADYSKGVLERFTRRAEDDWGKNNVSTIANPRKVKVFVNPHFAVYFEGFINVNEEGKLVPLSTNKPPTVNKIVMNHYHTKSFEEYEKKVKRGNADHFVSNYDIKNFDDRDRNEVFDDSILAYRENRLKMWGEGTLGRQINYQRLYIALLQNLSQTFLQNVPPQFYQGKMETFLTCWKLAEYLREKVLDKNAGNFFAESALVAVYKTLQTNFSIADLRLLFNELPNLLTLNYSAIKNIRAACINILPQFMNIFRVHNAWQDFTELEYLLNMLKTFDSKQECFF